MLHSLKIYLVHNFDLEISMDLYTIYFYVMIKLIVDFTTKYIRVSFLLSCFQNRIKNRIIYNKYGLYLHMQYDRHQSRYLQIHRVEFTIPSYYLH